MRARSRELLERAIAAMLAAIEIYNKPTFPYRAESFMILAVNAWELLVKAKWLADHSNRLSSLYVRQGRGIQKRRIKRTAAGNPMTFGLDYIADKLRETKSLDENACDNLRILSELRHSAVHFYHLNPQLAERLQEIGAAAVRNFRSAVADWFKDNLSRHNVYLMPLAFVSPSVTRVVALTTEEKRFLKYLTDQTSNAEQRLESNYAVTMNVEVRFVKSKSSDAMAVRVTADPTAPAVRLTEEEVRERYPWGYYELTKRCQERYTNFKIDQKYHVARKAAESDSRYAHVRQLDTKNPHSPKKTFFSTAMIEKLDTQYERKT